MRLPTKSAERGPGGEHKKRLAALRQALIEGEQSGDAVPFSISCLLEEAQRERNDRKATPRPLRR